MSHHELVQAYQDGQVSRRTFIRRLLASGVSLGAAMVYAQTLAGQPAAAYGPDDFYCPPANLQPPDIHIHARASNVFDPGTVVALQGTCIGWHFHATHSVENNIETLASGFRSEEDSLTRNPYVREFPAAGTYKYRCGHTTSEHPFMGGTIKVPMKVSPAAGPLGTGFRITWSSESDLQGQVPGQPHGVLYQYVFDVQRRTPGGSSFNLWQSQVRKRRNTFVPQQKGSFQFRARLTNAATGRHSLWSPIAEIEVS